MKKYEMAWTTKDGRRIENQLYTADRISDLLKDLEEWNATDISMTEYEENTDAYGVMRTDEDGYIFKSKTRTYSLYDGVTIGADKEYSSDIIFIMDDKDVDRETRMVGFVYGASELDGLHVSYSIRGVIEQIVKDYERKESI